MSDLNSPYCCMYCIPKITLYFSTDKYDGICQNCINLLAIQAVFRSKLYKHSFSLFKDGYFNHQRFTLKLNQQGEVIEQEYDYCRDGVNTWWDSWINDELPKELASRARKWYEEFKPKSYQAISDEIYILRFWSEKSLVDISVSSPNYWRRQDASELHEFSEIWNTLMELGVEDVELKKVS